ncbi:MAG: DUF664 domain-containing protein [Phycisphaeraceae bacterium]|nr:DUF664 domain-containing protein [Phycisphaeraceae bacterium]
MSNNSPRVEHFRNLQRYEQWAGARVVASLRSAHAAAVDRASSDRARGIFGHIQMARHEWLFRLGQIPKRPWIMFPDWSVEECAADAARLDGAWSAYLANLGDADLDGEVRYTSNEGKPFVSLRRDILTHVINHSTYHRGQIALLVKAAGGAPEATDFVLYSRQAGIG